MNINKVVFTELNDASYEAGNPWLSSDFWTQNPSFPSSPLCFLSVIFKLVIFETSAFAFFFLSNNNEQWPPQTLLNCLESIIVKLCYRFSCVIMNYNLFRPGTIFFFCVCTMYSQSFTRTLGNGGDRVNWVDGYWVLATEADKFPKVRSILFQVVPCPITSPFYR